MKRIIDTVFLLFISFTFSLSLNWLELNNVHEPLFYIGCIFALTYYCLHLQTQKLIKANLALSRRFNELLAIRKYITFLGNARNYFVQSIDNWLLLSSSLILSLVGLTFDWIYLIALCMFVSVFYLINEIIYYTEFKKIGLSTNGTTEQFSSESIYVEDLLKQITKDKDNDDK